MVTGSKLTDIERYINSQQDDETLSEDKDWWYLEGYIDGILNRPHWTVHGDLKEIQASYDMGYADGKGDLEF